MYLQGTGHILTNIQAYNNTSFGIYANHADYLAINNTQAYNNSIGIQIGYGTNILMNNIQSYNNNLYGIETTRTLSGVKFNNISTFNN